MFWSIWSNFWWWSLINLILRSLRKHQTDPIFSKKDGQPPVFSRDIAKRLYRMLFGRLWRFRKKIFEKDSFSARALTSSLLYTGTENISSKLLAKINLQEIDIINGTKDWTLWVVSSNSQGRRVFDPLLNPPLIIINGSLVLLNASFTVSMYEQLGLKNELSQYLKIKVTTYLCFRLSPCRFANANIKSPVQSDISPTKIIPKTTQIKVTNCCVLFCQEKSKLTEDN